VVTLATAQRNFGDKWAGIADFDLRYRHREADLWANPMSRTTLKRRNDVMRRARAMLAQASWRSKRRSSTRSRRVGRAALTTHHNALDTDLRASLSQVGATRRTMRCRGRCGEW